MSIFESIRTQIDDAKNPEAAVTMLIKGIILKLGEALQGQDTEHQVRVLRDHLEEDKEGLVRTVISKTGEDRGPDAPDDSQPILAEEEAKPFEQRSQDFEGPGYED